MLPSSGASGTSPDKSELHEKVRRRLLKEADELCRSSPSPYFYASPQSENLREWRTVLIGPPETVYEQGVFFVALKVPDDYPFKPPEVRFLTRIYHCNINSSGVVCLDLLRAGWRPTYTIKDVLFGLVSLLYAANPQDPLVGSIARDYEQNRAEHDRVASLWTRRFAFRGCSSYEQQETVIQDRASRNRLRRPIGAEANGATAQKHVEGSTSSSSANSDTVSSSNSSSSSSSSSDEDQDDAQPRPAPKRTRTTSGSEDLR